MRCLLLLGALALSGCSDDNTPRCSPDATVSGCFCPNGRRGAQRCDDDGVSLGDCVCAPEDGAVNVLDATADTPTPTD